MSIKTITKIVCFVISLFAVIAGVSSCSGIFEKSPMEGNASPYKEPEILARISSAEINESSGLAVSRCQSDVFWTHNDSGGGPFVYAFNSAGKTLGVWRVSEATNVDWEDMATIAAADGKCYLYMGDIGDNEQKRDSLVIYRFPEPSTIANASNLLRETATSTEKVEVLRFRYPTERFNAEALLVNQVSGSLYVVTKSQKSSAQIFVLKPNFNTGEVSTATKVADVSLPASPVGQVTGGAISPDGKRLVICDYSAGYEFNHSENSNEFEEVWNQKPTRFNLGPRFIGESVSFGSDSSTVFATTEKADAPLIRVERKK